jgi:hypothetical protein
VDELAKPKEGVAHIVIVDDIEDEPEKPKEKKNKKLKKAHSSSIHTTSEASIPKNTHEHLKETEHIPHQNPPSQKTTIEHATESSNSCLNHPLPKVFLHIFFLQCVNSTCFGFNTSFISVLSFFFLGRCFDVARYVRRKKISRIPHH